MGVFHRQKLRLIRKKKPQTKKRKKKTNFKDDVPNYKYRDILSHGIHFVCRYPGTSDRIELNVLFTRYTFTFKVVVRRGFNAQKATIHLTGVRVIIKVLGHQYW